MLSSGGSSARLEYPDENRENRWDKLHTLSSGGSSARLEYLVWDQGVAGSNPVLPTLLDKRQSSVRLPFSLSPEPCFCIEIA
jgi:hypothetical protein